MLGIADGGCQQAAGPPFRRVRMGQVGEPGDRHTEEIHDRITVFHALVVAVLHRLGRTNLPERRLGGVVGA